MSLFFTFRFFGAVALVVMGFVVAFFCRGYWGR